MIINKIKLIFLKTKLWFISIVGVSVIYLNMNVVYCAEYLYKDVSFIHSYLIKSDLSGVIMKMIGSMIYDICSWLLDSCYSAYMSISNFDPLKNASIQNIIKQLDTLIYAVFFIIFVVAIICKMFKLDNPMKVLLNAFLVLTCVVCFSTLLEMGNNMKNATIKDIDVIMNQGEYKLSDTLYAENTVDILKSLKANKLVKLKVNEMDSFDSNEIIKRDVFAEYSRIDDNGQVVYEEFDNGFFSTGIGEVRYYRYNTSFWDVNMSILASLFVYIVAMLKHAFLLVEWFYLNIFGRFALGRGFFAIDNLGGVAKSAVGNLVAQVILYTMMSLFTLWSVSVMTSSTNWIIQAIMIWAFGITVIAGSSFISNGLGIEDNFGKVATGMFLTKKLLSNPKNKIKSLKKSMSKSQTNNQDNETKKMDDIHQQLTTDGSNNPFFENDKDIHQEKEHIKNGETLQSTDDIMKTKLNNQSDKISITNRKVDVDKMELTDDTKAKLYTKDDINKKIDKDNLTEQTKKKINQTDYHLQKDGSYTKDSKKNVEKDDDKRMKELLNKMKERNK